MAESTGNTGTRDVTFNLVSIMYHALQGAETIDKYIADADQGRNPDLTNFFEETKREYANRAEKAKELLFRESGSRSESAGGQR